MLIMREPLKPKSLSPVKCFLGDAMEKRIAANYRQMEAQYSEEELFHIASQPPEIYLEEGGRNASLINQTNIRNQQEIKLELVCNLLNRLAVSGEGKYTYQDRVYIENMLRKLNVRDTQTFMRQVQNFREDTQNVRSLLQIYQQHFNSLKSAVGSVSPEQERTGARKKENGEYTQEDRRERYLHQSILERLGTDRVNMLLREVYRPVPSQEQKVSRQEIVLSEQSRLGAGMELQNAENRVLGRKVPAHFSRVNIYEEGAKAAGEVTKQEILSELSEALLLNLTDSLYQIRQESIRNGRDLYLTWNGGFEQIVENTMERFLAGHSEEPVGERSVQMQTAYQERVNEVRRQEVAQLRQITAELQVSEENSSQPEKMAEAERVYLESRKGEAEEDRMPESETVRIRSLTIDRTRAKRDSLRALENPKEVIREYLASTTELEELEARRDRSIRESMSEETRRMLSRVEELRPGTVPGFQNRDSAAVPERPGEPAETELSHREPVSVPETEEESAEQEAQRRENEILREELLREVLTAAERLTRTETAEAELETGIQNRDVSDAGSTSTQQGAERAEAYRQLITLRAREEETRLSQVEELCRRMEELYVNWNQDQHTRTEETVWLQQEISRIETFAASSRQRLRELLETIDTWKEESETEYREWQSLYHNIEDIEQSIQQIRSLSAGQQIPDAQRKAYIDSLHRIAEEVRSWREYWQENGVSLHSIRPLQILYRELEQASEEVFDEAPYNSISEQNTQGNSHAELIRETAYLLEQLKMAVSPAAAEPFYSSKIRGAAEEQIKRTEYDRQTSQTRSTVEEMLNQLEVSHFSQREELIQRLTEISRSSEEFLEYARKEIPGEDESDSVAQQQPRTESSAENENVTSIVHAAAELETIQNNIQREIETIITGIQTAPRPAADVFAGNRDADGKLTVIHRQLAGEQSREAYTIPEEQHEMLRREQTDYERYRTELTEMYSELQRVKSILPDTPENQERLQSVSSRVKETLEELRHIAETVRQQKELYRTLQIENILSEQSRTVSTESRSRQQAHERALRQYTELTELSKHMLEEETDETVTAVIQENLQKLEEIQERFDRIASRITHETEESLERQERTLLREQIENRQEYQNTLQEMLIGLQKSIAPSGTDSQNAGRMSAAAMNHRRLAAPEGEAGLRNAFTSALSGGEISVSHPAAARGGRMSDRREKAEYRRTLLRNKLEQTLENVRRENRSWMELLQATEYAERTDNLRELISRLHTWNTRMQNQPVSESVRETARMLLRRIWEVSLPADGQTPEEVREALSEAAGISARTGRPQNSLKPEVRQTILEYLETARTAETLEQEQIRTHEHRNREETEHLVQTVHRELLRQESSPWTGSAPMAQPSGRPNIELVHKQEQQGIDEAVLEEFRIRQRGSEMAPQERREEITNRNVSTARRINIPVPNMPGWEQTQINETISRTIQGQLNTISDQVYSRLEKRLTSDRKRRGY